MTNFALDLLVAHRDQRREIFAQVKQELADLNQAILAIDPAQADVADLSSNTIATRLPVAPQAPVTFGADAAAVEKAVEQHQRVAEAVAAQPFDNGGALPAAVAPVANETGEPEAVVTPAPEEPARPAEPTATPPQPSPVLTAQENAQKMPGETEPPWAAQERAAAAGAPASGRRTNEQIAAENGVSLDDVKAHAKRQGIKRVTKDVIEEYATLVRNGGAPGESEQGVDPAPEQVPGQQSIDDFGEDEPVVSAPPARPAEPTAAPVADPAAPQPMASATPFKPPF